MAQSANTLIKDGNEHYKKAQFGEALNKYKQAQQKNNSFAATYNTGNALFKMNKFEEAAKSFDAAASLADKAQAAKVWYNKGVSLAKAQKIQPAIDAFKQSLRLNHKDQDARENLQKALNELKQQQQKQQQNNNPQKPPEKKEQNKINKQQAEQLLQSLNQEEKKLQEQLQKRKNQPITKDKDW